MRFDWKRNLLIFAICAATKIAAGQTFTRLINFDNGSNGSGPAYMSLVQGADGKLYGTTQYGGTHCCQLGSVFKIGTGGMTTFATLGQEPLAGLVQGKDGSFYGTTSRGGNGGNGFCGCGTVFKITANGVVTTLYSFSGNDGSTPQGGLVQGTDGNLYGTTTNGGYFGEGTVFEITPAGILTKLHDFCSLENCIDGSQPAGSLIQGADGNFYGTTIVGGSSTNCFIGSGCGTIFQISSDGQLTTLHSFSLNDGAYPYDALVPATDGNFYGTTSGGGANEGAGTVFKVTPRGVLTTLVSFDETNGAVPYAGLIQATDGNFYGTTRIGGASNYGTVFMVTPDGTLTTIHTFTGTDGAYPEGGLVQDTNGKLYGTASEGSTDGGGIVFSINMGLDSFVTFARSYGKVGQTSGILGQGFTGATNVSLNGTPASFVVVSDTLIKATVPAGATSGYVTVTTPSGVLTSNVPFHVIP